MIEMSITTNLPQFQSKVRELRVKVPQMFHLEAMGEIAHSLERGVRQTARSRFKSPYSLGYFAESLRVIPNMQAMTYQLWSDAYYWPYQEFGYTRTRPIPLQYLEQHLGAPTIPGKRVARPGPWVFPTKHTPVVAPAVNSLNKRIPSIINRFLDKMLKAKGL